MLGCSKEQLSIARSISRCQEKKRLLLEASSEFLARRESEHSCTAEKNAALQRFPLRFSALQS